MFTQIRKRARRSLAALTATVLFAGVTVAGAAMPAAAEVAPPATAAPVLTVTPGEIDDVTKEVTLNVSGTGYVGDGAVSGAYILVGDLDVWTPGSGPLKADGWVAQDWVQASRIKDGAFTTAVKIPANSFDTGKTYQVASSAAHGLSVSNRTLDAQAKFTTKAEVVPEPEAPAADAVVMVSKSTGLNPDGETITVSGSGFLPAADGATTGARPPLAGKFTGAYVVLGDFADVWKPSDKAPSSARKALSQFWAVPAESVSTIGGPAAGAVELKADGTFSVEFEVKKDTEIAGNLGIYTYAAGGSTYAQFETYTPLNFAEVEEPEAPVVPEVQVSKTAGLNPDGETITVSGSGFLPAADGATTGVRPPLAGKFTGTYVIFGDFADVWKPSESAPSSARDVLSQFWAVPAESVNTIGGANAGAVELKADGTFSVEFEVKKGAEVAGNLGIYTYAAGGSKYAQFETYTPLSFAEVEAPVVPEVQVSKSTGLNPDGETITVSGSGFLPAADGATTGVRPPLAGKFTGTYVIFGDFADVWKPSESAPSSARDVLSQFWAVPAESVNTIGGANAGAVELKADGTFSVEFEVKKGAEVAGNLGIYTYAAGGSKYAQFETYTPLAFADSGEPEVPVDPEVPSKADPKLTVTPGEIADVSKENTLTVSGTGYVGDGAKMGAYVVVGDKSIWTPGSDKPLVADGWAALAWVPANQIVDGKFTVSVKVPAKSLEGGQEYQVATSAAHQLSATDRTLDAQALITTKKIAGVEPTPKPTPDPEPEVPTAKVGNLQWGIDKTFVDYIPGSIAKGKIEVSNGATFTKGLFNFPQNGKATAGTGIAKFYGNVAFSGHNGALDSQFGALELKFLGKNKAELWGTVTANSMSGESLLKNAKVVIAKVDLKPAVTNKDNSVTYTSNGVTLTADGAKAFGNYYGAGQKVSELSFTVGAPAKEQVTPPKDVTPKPNPSDKKPEVPGNGAVTAPEAAGKQPEVCVARTLTGATMSWNFKSSFVRYVGGLSDGKISASGVSQGNGFAWSGGSGKYNEAASKGLISFGGTVQFSGHAGVMDAKFSNMRVQFLGANSAALIADVVSNDMNGKAVTLNGTQIATISLGGKKATSGSTVTWSNAPVTLTSAGAKAFGGFYNAGEALDPITISATLGANTDCDTSTGTLAATGLSEQTTGVVGIAIAFLAAGAAVLVVGNRRKLAPVRK